jgi:hypothetical protein
MLVEHQILDGIRRVVVKVILAAVAAALQQWVRKGHFIKRVMAEQGLLGLTA